MLKQARWLTEAGTRIVGPPEGSRRPYVLLYDIETTPQLAWQWGSGKYDSRTLKVAKPRYMLSVVYKWLGQPEGENQFVSIFQDPAFKPDPYWAKYRPQVDRYPVGALWHLFSQADVTIAHNGDKFDTKRTNARFKHHRLPPPSPPRTIDTLKEYRRYFAFPSNRLNDLGQELGVGHKEPHMGLDTWFGCMEGDPDMWDVMERYNRQDVELLERVFMEIAPWIGSPGKSIPGVNAASYNAGAWDPEQPGRPGFCPKIGCTDPLAGFMARGFDHRSSGLIYQKWQCNGCGGYVSNRYAERDAHSPLVK